ncbi:TPA: DNA polymerase III subunit delta' C-terminal domain-containing protein [Legionella feeleii]|uniref:DNA polymerase III subunit delta' n=1 Tax=Legionella feeleii TaxID=453 RepID=A0A378ITX4_9GAMM|nr:DNA polymerase III subunit delta' [Legionella feeleii]STX38362.1 DNA polymerase III, delta' subunit [Legionella feeleii]
MPPKTLELLPAHTEQWAQLQKNLARQCLHHALLLVAPQHGAVSDFADRMAAAILCPNAKKPCGECKSCHLVTLDEHPDLCYLQPDKAGGAIKIEQIRDIQALLYTSPQLGNHRVVLIHPAEKMNVAAANALLKLLEEPPDEVIFILLAEQVSTILPTILSRCQLWRFPSTEILHSDYLSLGEGYTTDSERGKLFSQLPVILQDLLALMGNKISVCSLAAKWLSYEINDLLWLVYLINAQMINYRLNNFQYEKSWTLALHQLASHFHPLVLFRQLDELNRLSKKLNQSISMNQTLILENLLFEYKKK